MIATLKAMPIVPKILLCCLLVGGLYSEAHHPHRGYSSSSLSNAGYRSGAAAADQTAALAQFQSQQAQLMVQVIRCEAQVTEAANRMRDNAVQGGFCKARLECEQQMPQWTAPESCLETAIYRVQTGDNSRQLHLHRRGRPPA